MKHYLRIFGLSVAVGAMLLGISYLTLEYLASGDIVYDIRTCKVERQRTLGEFSRGLFRKVVGR